MWVCVQCNREWYYPVEHCIFCKSKLVQKKSEKYHVITHTTVYIPTPKHPKVPYHLYLLEGDGGDRVLYKSFVQFDADFKGKWPTMDREGD